MGHGNKSSSYCGLKSVSRNKQIWSFVHGVASLSGTHRASCLPTQLCAVPVPPGIGGAVLQPPQRIRGLHGVLSGLGLDQHALLHPRLPADGHLRCHDRKGGCTVSRWIPHRALLASWVGDTVLQTVQPHCILWGGADSAFSPFLKSQAI